jgi:hypothetical protein
MSKFSIERVTVLLTPFYAAGAAWLTGLIATAVPGAPPVDPAAVQGLEATAVLGTVAIIHKWLNGRQSPELLKLEQDAKADAAKVVKVADEIAPGHKDLVTQLEGVGEAELKRAYDVIKAKLPAVPEPLAEIPVAAPAPAGDFPPQPPAPVAPPAAVVALGVDPASVAADLAARQQTAIAAGLPVPTV